MPNHEPFRVDTTPPAGGRYKAIADLMARRPIAEAIYPNERAFTAAKVAWLLSMADALDAAGLDNLAEDTREAALGLVHTAVTKVAGGVV